MICPACGGVGEDANAPFWCGQCKGTGVLRCELCAAGYPVSDDGQHFAGDELYSCRDWVDPTDEEEEADDEPDFSRSIDPVDPLDPDWRP